MPEPAIVSVPFRAEVIVRELQGSDGQTVMSGIVDFYTARRGEDAYGECDVWFRLHLSIKLLNASWCRQNSVP